MIIDGTINAVEQKFEERLDFKKRHVGAEVIFVDGEPQKPITNLFGIPGRRHYDASHLSWEIFPVPDSGVEVSETSNNNGITITDCTFNTSNGDGITFTTTPTYTIGWQNSIGWE